MPDMSDGAQQWASQFCASSPEQVDAVMSGLLLWAREQPPRHGLYQLHTWRGRIEVCRSQIIDDQQSAGVEGAALDRLIGNQSTTRADRKRAKLRAETINRNSELADEVTHGRLTIDQLDAICDADVKTDGRAANDKKLLGDVAAAPADAARRTADNFVKAQQSGDDLEERRRQQRRQRCARKGNTADGLASLTITGDDESVYEMWSAIVDTAQGFYRADGGRDLKAVEHPRTDAQRLFDAAHHHLINANDATSRARPVIVVTAAKLAGDPDQPPAELVGVGPVPDSLLEHIACGSDFVGMVFDGEGEVLWQGRSRRYPTKAQMLALIARDQGCVLCGADPQRCEAHHLMPWSAPGRGKTDIDELALLCGSCHRDLHDRNHTLYRDRTDGRWRTRPATPHETPKRRPPGRRIQDRQRAEPPTDQIGLS